MPSTTEKFSRPARFAGRRAEPKQPPDSPQPAGGPTPYDVAVAAPVLAAMWCRSVGATWTLELHRLEHETTVGTIVDWISSGVPISQPEPAALADELLTERGLYVFRDSSCGPSTHSRHSIGYVCRDGELIRLAHLVRDGDAATHVHPVALAESWVSAGFSADTAAGWIRAGVRSPDAAHLGTKRPIATRWLRPGPVPAGHDLVHRPVTP